MVHDVTVNLLERILYKANGTAMQKRYPIFHKQHQYRVSTFDLPDFHMY